MVSILKDVLPIGIYRTLDDIECLKIRIHIKKSSNVSVPIRETSDSSSMPHEYELMQLHNKEQESYAEYTFSWQEKVVKNENVGTSIEESGSCVPLFSYVSTELSSLDQEEKMWIAVRHLKTEKNGSSVGKTFNSDGIKTYQKPYFLKELVHMSNRKTPSYITGQSMSIMALLDANDSSDAEEVQLCYLTYDSKGGLTVIPDFSNSPYFIQSSKSENYEFLLENVSNSIKSSDAELEATFLKKVYEHHASTISSIVGSEFDVPKSKTKVFYILGELISAANFNAKNLFVHFTFELPNGAVIINGNSLQGFTNFCKVKKKSHGIGTIAHFGLPLTLQFEVNESEDVRDVHLLLEVSSLDFWNMCRSEGYGFCTFPTTPGYQSIEAKMWKLLPQSIPERLRHFFIGKNPYLDDLKYVQIPTLSEGNLLSKYGVRTETSGSVFLKFHTIVQTS